MLPPLLMIHGRGPGDTHGVCTTAFAYQMEMGAPAHMSTIEAHHTEQSGISLAIATPIMTTTFIPVSTGRWDYHPAVHTAARMGTRARIAML